MDRMLTMVKKDNAMEQIFDQKYPNINVYRLESESLCVDIINLGATITSIRYKKDDTDVVLGYNTIDEYQKFKNYYGATIGRCANRIAKGAFTLHDQTYHLDINDHGNSLHGGKNGFHTHLFQVLAYDETSVTMRYNSLDMEEGYPGNLTLDIIFALHDDTLSIQYSAISDQDTIVNFTNHSYFALQGHGDGSVDEQILTMNASYYAENDENRLVTGKLSETKGTPFDFTKGKAIGKDIYDQKNIQIKRANGYDHYFRFDENKEHMVKLVDQKHQHSLIVKTDLPGFHLYVPDDQEPQHGKHGKEYIGHCAVCIETSYMPDAINLQECPETLLKANEKYTTKTTYQFQ